MNSIEEIATFEVKKYDAVQNVFSSDEKLISVEKLFELRLNDEFYRNIFCTPENVEDLTVGILAQADKISAVENISRLEINGSIIEVEINSKVHAAQINFSNVKFIAKDILNCADKLLGEMSTTHDKTNGTHSGILFDGENILIYREDIGRHDVFDKIYGAALRQNIFLGDKALIFSGRCSSEMIIKVARMNIPVVVAKSVPTTYSINIAKKFGVTLAGRLTTDSFCIYSNAERIVLS